MMQLTNKWINKIEASCTLEGTVLENVDSIKYLGVTITNDLKWNTHITNICTKANTWILVQDVKEAAYKELVRPVLEYGSSVRDPHTKGIQEELEKVQTRAARFVTRNYTFEEESMTGVLVNGNLSRKGGRIIEIYCYTKV